MKYFSIDITSRWTSSGELPRHTGSMFRGTFGHVLKRTVCVRNGECDRCHLRYDCAYSVAFESPVPPDTDWFPAYSKGTHPFAFTFPCGGGVSEGQLFGIGLRLFGRAVALAPYFVHAVRQQGLDGVGRDGVEFAIERVVDSKGFVVHEAPDDVLRLPREHPDLPELPVSPPTGVGVVTVRFDSPCRVVEGGHTLGGFSARPLAASILRRYSALHALHGEGRPELRFREWVGACAAPTVLRDGTRPVRMARYSNRQQRRHELHGFDGEVHLERCPVAFIDVLRLGEIIQVGKSTAFGCGVVRAMVAETVQQEDHC